MADEGAVADLTSERAVMRRELAGLVERETGVARLDDEGFFGSGDGTVSKERAPRGCQAPRRGETLERVVRPTKRRPNGKTVPRRAKEWGAPIAWLLSSRPVTVRPTPLAGGLRYFAESPADCAPQSAPARRHEWPRSTRGDNRPAPANRTHRVRTGWNRFY